MHKLFHVVAVLPLIWHTALLANPTWAVVEPAAASLDPSAGRGPIYFYECVDSDCASQTQLPDNGYVTQVPTWNALSPATWVFLETGGVEERYVLWQLNDGAWTNCTLHLQGNGDIGPDNTCPGAMKSQAFSSQDVSKIALGAAVFPGRGATPKTPTPYNPTGNRSITFSNATDAVGICLQTDSSFAHTLCSGVYVYDLYDDPYVRSIPQNGDNSRAAQVIGIKYDSTKIWTGTGRDSSTGQVYASKMEWTAFPTEVSESTANIPEGSTDHSIGPTTIDMSLVDGFNVGVELAPDQDVVCAVSEVEGGPLVFKLFRSGTPLAQFPNDVNMTVDDICPSEFEVTRGPNQVRLAGCYSQCSWAHATAQDHTVIDQNCCSNQFDTYVTCDPVVDRQYIDPVTSNSKGIYTWAYDDYRGTFTCDGTASFSLQITDVFDRPGLSPP